ncbi:SEC23 interacting protein L homeolog isoform X1 [Xenopus laevis]|uniref:SEC23 interacting protein L homeolog isoform X1 n=1 Tax=Xenopus laevis TaxID=8355 RepID=A0A8J1L4J8_XENLA|nr:SEC23 interacting protein L homeolog isoform X1 [Xenopus laevis]
MAGKVPNGAQSGPPGNNLLFSASEISFSLPFIPVSQHGPGPAMLPADDASEVGEEDSFLGQTSAATNPPQTFSYFSGPGSSQDPFAAIVQPPLTTAASSPGTSVFFKPPSSMLPISSPEFGRNLIPPKTAKPPVTSNAPVSQVTTGVFLPTSHQGPPPGAYAAPPTSSSQAGYNPYRHNIQSSRVNPYLAPPQLQQEQELPLFIQNPQFPPQPQFQPQGLPASLPPPPRAAPNMPPPPPSSQTFPNVRPAGPSVPVPPPYLPNLYAPVQPHWFYCKQVEDKEVWLPFSTLDSHNLEEIYNSVQPDPESVVVNTDGGRYDVYLYNRERKAVFWEEEESEVRRCSWFYKGDSDSKFVPYSEDFSERLEAEYKKAVTTNQWHRRLEFPGGETIVMHNPKFQQSLVPEEWGPPQDGQSRPRVVKRGIDAELDEIPDGEVPQADHLVFMVHGIGPVCDLRFRSIIECVDDFRTVSLKLLQTHYRKSLEEGKARRVEFLPVHWHSSLHGDATGVDRRIKKITLPSIGRLRHFTNETLLDILFYNSPTYCQTIVDKVNMEMNRLFALFMSRNPHFTGGVSVAGHSLGSLVLFDILSNQTDPTAPPLVPVRLTEANGPLKSKDSDDKAVSITGAPVTLQAVEEPSDSEQQKPLPSLQEALELLSLAEYSSVFEKEQIDMESLLMCTVDDLKEMGIPLGPRKKIAKFVQERAVTEAKRKAAEEEKAAQIKAKEELAAAAQEAAAKLLPSEDSSALESHKRKLPVGVSVSAVPVDYEYFETGTGQVCVKYNSLDFEPVNFFALGSPIGMFLTVRGLDKIEETFRLPTCKGFFNIYHPLDPVAYRLEPMIIPDIDLKPVLIPHHKGRKRLHLELKESLTRMGSDLKHGFITSLRSAWQTLNDFARAHTSSAQLQLELKRVADQIEEEEKQQQVEAEKIESPDASREEEVTVKIGMLNGGRRIDYVLQEKPIESFNEYLFALQSHLCYWESEDTALLILKEIYTTVNVLPDHPLQ